MDRRTALKLMGVLVICLGGKVVYGKNDVTIDDTGIGDIEVLDPFGPVDYHFGAEDIRDLIITRKDKQDIVIPFTEIIEALEK